jgi:hypothetical protein
MTQFGAKMNYIWISQVSRVVFVLKTNFYNYLSIFNLLWTGLRIPVKSGAKPEFSPRHRLLLRLECGLIPIFRRDSLWSLPREGGYGQTLTIRSTGTGKIKTRQPKTGTRLGPVIPKSTAQKKNRRDRVTPLRSRSDGSHYPDQPVSGASDRSRLSHDLRPCPRLPKPKRRWASTAAAPWLRAALPKFRCPNTSI